MPDDAGPAVDRHARNLGRAGLIVSLLSLAVAAGSAWISYSNRADAAERISIRIVRARGDQDADVSLPTTALVAEGRKIILPARRRTWEVLISNTSLSAEATITALVVGERYTSLEPVADELSRVRARLADVPPLPINLGPSRTASLIMVTETPVNSDHVPVLVVATSRGRQYLATPAL